MVGSFGVIGEDVGADAGDLTHRQRFGARGRDPRLRKLRWQSGRDVLLVQSTHSESDTNATLPPRPRRLADERLWIPVSDADSRVVGPTYRIGSQVVGSLIRIRAEKDVQFLPDLVVIVGSRRARVLGAIDSLDPSGRRQLEKVISVSRESDLDGRALFPGIPGDPGTDPPMGGLPPAAKTILTTIEQDMLGTSHVLSFQRRGAGGLVNLLEDRGLIRVLPSGQIISSGRYRELRETLAEPGLSLDPSHASKLWGTSVGMAGALLDAYALDGMIERVSARHYERLRDDQA